MTEEQHKVDIECGMLLITDASFLPEGLFEQVEGLKTGTELTLTRAPGYPVNGVVVAGFGGDGTFNVTIQKEKGLVVGVTINLSERQKRHLDVGKPKTIGG